jgi:hypothetical protein
VSAFSLSVTEVDQLRTVVELCALPAEQAADAVWPVLESLQALVGCEAVIFNGMDPPARMHGYCSPGGLARCSATARSSPCGSSNRTSSAS